MASPLLCKLSVNLAQHRAILLRWPFVWRPLEIAQTTQTLFLGLPLSFRMTTTDFIIANWQGLSPLGIYSLLYVLLSLSFALSFLWFDSHWESRANSVCESLPVVQGALNE